MLGEVEVHKQKKGPKPMFLKEHKLASPVTCCQIIFQSPRWCQFCLQTDSVNLVMDKDEKDDGDDENWKEEETISMNTQTGFEVDSSAINSD